MIFLCVPNAKLEMDSLPKGAREECTVRCTSGMNASPLVFFNFCLIFARCVSCTVLRVRGMEVVGCVEILYLTGCFIDRKLVFDMDGMFD